MKHFLYQIMAALISLCLFCSFLPDTYAADITLVIDGKRVASETAPEVRNGVTFVPLRVVSEYLGADVDWFEGVVRITNYTQTPKVKRQSFEIGGYAIWTEYAIRLIPGESVAHIDYNGSLSGKGAERPELFDSDEETELLAAPFIKEGRVMVPLRFIAERMSCLVEYQAGRITITPQQVLSIDGERVWYLMLGEEYITQRRVLISDTIKMITESRREAVAAPVRTKAVTSVLNFGNEGRQVMVSWQFCIPEDVNGDKQPFGVLYLHDVLHDAWYEADPLVFDGYFQQGPYLYSVLTLPDYDFEEL